MADDDRTREAATVKGIKQEKRAQHREDEELDGTPQTTRAQI